MKKFYLFLSLFFSFLAQAHISSLGNVCAGNLFNLTSKTQELIGLQKPNNFVVTFYITQANAVAGTNAIVSPNIYLPSSNVQQIVFARIFNSTTSTFTVNSFALVNATSLVANVSSVAGQQATISGSGGTPSYMYCCNNLPWTAMAMQSNLGPGTFVATVKDANGCIASTNFSTSAGFEAVDDLLKQSAIAISAL